MPIVATAGHVDHGKSTLVQALTGRDPDRWKEEKERGLTIDLGFAWAEIAGAAIGFVDVPGHERFIKNMLAGIGGLDVALLVVAADEGWMPQTEEHAAVLDLLDVRHGVIALTRSDLADADTRELAALDVEEQVAGLTLESWPVVEVSATTGAGLEALRATLTEVIDRAGPPRDTGRPRLWVDRSFVISGAGVVVTGTLLNGTLTKGDQVAINPGERSARIRGIQTHETEIEVVAPGNRAAINLSGLERTEVGRGDVLVAPGTGAESKRFLVTARPVRGVEKVTDRGAYHLHAGTGAWSVKVRSVGPDVFLVTADDTVPLLPGDRFILRETGRRAVIGGGRVVDSRPGHQRRDQYAAAAASIAPAIDGPPDELAQRLLNVRGEAPIEELAIDSGGGQPPDAIVSGSIAIHPNRAADIIRAAVAVTSEFHAANPLRDGVPKATLASAIGVAPAVAEAVVATDESLVDEGSTVRLASHQVGWDDAADAEWHSARRILQDAGAAAPRASQLGLRPELLHAAVRRHKLVKVADDLVYLPEQLNAIKEALRDLPAEFTVADFRDRLEISRRQAVPLLEWLDATGVTSRRGDVRSLR